MRACLVAVLKTVLEKSFWKEFFRTYFLFYVFREKKICLVELIKEYRQVKQKTCLEVFFSINKVFSSSNLILWIYK